MADEGVLVEEGVGEGGGLIHSSEALSAADQASYLAPLPSGTKPLLGRMLKSGASAKLIHTSFPPDPPLVGSPSVPVSNVQWPAATTTVGLTGVPVQVNQAPGSLNLGSIARTEVHRWTSGGRPRGSTGAGVTRT